MIGWFTNIADAEAYFTTDRLETTYWDNLATDPKKTKAVINGYNRIFYNQDYNVPAAADATAAQLVILKKVNGEMAYFLAVHAADEDDRAGLIAQGVVEAKMSNFEEKYGKISGSAVPPFIDDMLDDFKDTSYMSITDIERDENYRVDEDVTDDFIKYG